MYLLRLGALAELDAINLYEHLASLARDPYVKELFEHIARDEKTHLSEFYLSLYEYDAGQRVGELSATTDVCMIAKHHNRFFAICSPSAAKEKKLSVPATFK